MNKNHLTLLSLFFVFTLFGQNKWQELIFDKNANFFEIKNDFNIYQSIISKNTYKIPKGFGIKQFKRWEYYWESRIDIHGNFPKTGNTLEEVKKYNNNYFFNKSYKQGEGNWSIVGPKSTPVNGTRQLNGSGRLTCITFHPTDSNTIFVGAPSGGIFKSIDNGNSWEEFSIGLTRLGVSSIVINSFDPSIIYVGTGDRDSGDAPGYGVWKSIDGGLSWNPQNNGMGNKTINELIINPNNPNILLAAASDGRIYKTINGGLNWTKSNFLGTNPKEIIYHPTNPDIVYASGTNFQKSIDGGNTWSIVSSGVPIGAQRIALGVSINEPNWVYLLAGNSSGLMGIYQSKDSGNSFVEKSNSPNILGYEIDGSDSSSQAWYDLVLAVDPNNAKNIYTGGINIWKSDDEGASFNCVSYWVRPTGEIDGVHADQHVLEFSPYTNDIFSGNDGGIYFSENQGLDWNNISNGLSIAQVYKIGVSQSVSDMVITGFQDNGTAVSKDGFFKTIIGGDGMECIIDPYNADYIYGALYYGDIRRSNDGGISFATIAKKDINGITETGAWVTPYKLDPNNSNSMFVGYQNIWRTINLKSVNETDISWLKISNFSGTSKIRDLAIAPSNSNVIYVSRYDNKLYRTDNGNSSNPVWVDLGSNLPISNEPLDIEIDITDSTHLFIALNNNIYESFDSGNTWVDISGSLPNISLNTIVLDNTSSIHAMYVGMDLGVYYKDDNQSDWSPYSEGLSNVEITELEIQYGNEQCDNNLYAATYGQGLWKSKLKDPGNLAPVACFDVNTTQGCVGNTFTFTDNSAFSPSSWIWSISPNDYVFVNGTNKFSQHPEIVFNSPGFYDVQLIATNSTSNSVKSKNSYIKISNGDAVNNFVTDFEIENICDSSSNCGEESCVLSGNWINLSNGIEDDIDWRVDSNGTNSAYTGPTTDYKPGTITGKYVYTEASGCYGSTAILESNCINLNINYNLEFAYHMLGPYVGSLHVDIYNEGNWINDIITPIKGDQGNVWNLNSIDLTPYVGNVVKFRIRAVTGISYESDIAIDDIKFVEQTSLTVNNTYLENLGITLFPSPVNNILNISNKNRVNLKHINIYDLAGRKVYSETFEDVVSNKIINLEHLQSAFYIVVIDDGKNKFSERILKK